MAILRCESTSELRKTRDAKPTACVVALAGRAHRQIQRCLMCICKFVASCNLRYSTIRLFWMVLSGDHLRIYHPFKVWAFIQRHKLVDQKLKIDMCVPSYNLKLLLILCPNPVPYWPIFSARGSESLSAQNRHVNVAHGSTCWQHHCCFASWPLLFCYMTSPPALYAIIERVYHPRLAVAPATYGMRPCMGTWVWAPATGVDGADERRDGYVSHDLPAIPTKIFVTIARSGEASCRSDRKDIRMTIPASRGQVIDDSQNVGHRTLLDFNCQIAGGSE
eukprot:6179850-Pleurochrysis_carterae.AAC.1